MSTDDVTPSPLCCRACDTTTFADDRLQTGSSSSSAGAAPPAAPLLLDLSAPHNRPLLRKLRTCVDTHIDIADARLPRHLCAPCADSVQAAHRFRIRCEYVEQRWREVLEQKQQQTQQQTTEEEDQHLEVRQSVEVVDGVQESESHERLQDDKELAEVADEHQGQVRPADMSDRSSSSDDVVEIVGNEEFIDEEYIDNDIDDNCSIHSPAPIAAAAQHSDASNQVNSNDHELGDFVDDGTNADADADAVADDPDFEPEMSADDFDRSLLDSYMDNNLAAHVAPYASRSPSPSSPAPPASPTSSTSLQPHSSPAKTATTATATSDSASARRHHQHQCPICAKRFAKRYHLKNHLTIHDAANAASHRCALCERAYSNRGNLERHVRVHHQQQRGYACPLCDKAFSQSWLLKQHTATVHTDERTWACAQCDKRFKTREKLAAHCQRHEAAAGKQTDVVLVVEVEADGADETIEHVDVVRKPETAKKIRSKQPCACTLCGKQCGTAAAHAAHMRTHTGERPFECSECGKRFAFAQSLRTHRRQHTGERPYACDECGQRFWQIGHLAGHRLTHSGRRQHACSYCPKTFAVRGNLRVHERMHTGETPYRCRWCGKGFNDSNGLKRHMAIHEREGTQGISDEGRHEKTIVYETAEDFEDSFGFAIVEEEGDDEDDAIAYASEEGAGGLMDAVAEAAIQPSLLDDAENIVIMVRSEHGLDEDVLMVGV